MNDYLIELQEGEEILTTFRRHWIVLVRDIVVMLAMLFGVLLFLSISPSGIQSYTTFFGALLLLALYARSFVIWFKYYFDVWIVTNRRIVDIEQISLFNRKSSTVDPEHIEDITIHVNGFLQSVFGFGDLSIQTAGRVQEFLMHSIKDPDSAKKALYEAMQNSKILEHQRFAEHVSNAFDTKYSSDDARKVEPTLSESTTQEIPLPFTATEDLTSTKIIQHTPWDV